MSQAKRSALLLIDMQHGLYHAPVRPWQHQSLLDNVLQLLDRARAAGALVLAARHTGPDGSPVARGSDNWQFLPELALREEEIIFDKFRPSCFLDTGLQQLLQQYDIGQLVLAGMKTQYCVDATCRAAAEHGWQAVLASDAHSTVDSPQLSAAQIIAHHNATLQGAFVSVKPVAEIVF